MALSINRVYTRTVNRSNFPEMFIYVFTPKIKGCQNDISPTRQFPENIKGFLYCPEFQDITLLHQPNFVIW